MARCDGIEWGFLFDHESAMVYVQHYILVSVEHKRRGKLAHFEF